ncbi:hydroxymethylglutaryl-CoA synthase [Pseudoclavibacter endophyticus]|uniref:Hydroxymethylglutaryl-CoA synthase n=1 Tax=Pseudoclavibacter endophyticus TaxID=1778590 RepID=A0A6H9WLM6_9MICO|nr:hydroxymethylglutaryl-CoA synthase [Pseudoclavibacter endophyticus]KAB1650053.1 hydroxymethylglutaryl-CoA synthase [Pseudoclavibacter endophyticus]GGA57650.1 hydroxymethylglutaryl-CoA synthase [Pseudoclavibacter endophyticus]
MTEIGIHDIQLATAHHVLDLGDLAEHAGIDPNKYRIGLGQDEMSVAAPDEDIVTMAAEAAAPILERNGTGGIRTLLFATETGVDQSKSAGVFVHRLLGLSPTVRVVELKQACYSATAALQMAAGMIARNPDERVLVIASDIARYELDSSGEPTQGAGAVAFLVSTDPALVAIEPVSGVSTTDVDDFWRPNGSTTAVVDGALSVTAYLDALHQAWSDFAARGGAPIGEIERFLYHQPFTKMARKGHRHLAKVTGAPLDESTLESSFAYNRRIGNTYTASIYGALAALLDLDEGRGAARGLEGARLGFFSYGSGAVSELFTGIVQPGYRATLDPARAAAAMDARTRIDVATYRSLHAAIGTDDGDVETPRVTTGPFRFAGLRGRARQYERTA